MCIADEAMENTKPLKESVKILHASDYVKRTSTANTPSNMCGGLKQKVNKKVAKSETL